MDSSKLFEAYKDIVSKSDKAFERMQKEYGSLINCKIHCSDCCHAIFGLFLIEAAYIKRHIEELPPDEKEKLIERAKESEKDLINLQEKLKSVRGDHSKETQIFARVRVRCALLNDDEECILYPHRPITCRVYGIPISIHGKARACRKSGFKGSEYYPTFDLDRIYGELFSLSKELIKVNGATDFEKASLLISIPKVINSTMEEITKGII